MIVEARVVGRPGSDLETWEIDYAPEERVALRALITHVVRVEVDAFVDREHRFFRVLSSSELVPGVVEGQAPPNGEVVDPDEAVRFAVEAFEDGRYLVFVSDLLVQDLDERVEVEQATRVRFVRLA